VLEITGRILEILGKPASLIRHVTDRQGHDRRYWLTSRKLKRHLGWEARTTFERGIEETVRWYVENPAWWRRIKSGEFKDYYRKQYAEIHGGGTR
jgi:dTDP-glucose 4,6-dehydratase